MPLEEDLLVSAMESVKPEGVGVVVVGDTVRWRRVGEGSGVR